MSQETVTNAHHIIMISIIYRVQGLHRTQVTRLSHVCDQFAVDPDIIHSVFASHFHSFPSRYPSSGTMGRGPIFGRTIDIISDIPAWKRIRSTLSPGFSTKQLNQMLHAIEATIGTDNLMIH